MTTNDSRIIINGVELIPEKFYTPEEVAIVFGVKVATLAANRCRTNAIPFVKIGRRVMYRGSDLIAYINNSITVP